MIDVRQLQVLRAIEHNGSLSRAATELHLSVPTVAHHLDALEAALNAQLVHRSKRGTQLTAIGLSVAADAGRILSELRRTEQMVSDLRDAGLTSLRIGTFPSVGSRLLPWAVGQLQEQFRVRIEVIEGEPSTLIELVRAGDLHAAVVYGLASDPAVGSAELTGVALLEDDFEVMLAADHPLATRDRLDFAELEGEQWVMSHHEDEASNRILRQVCAASGYEARAVLRTDDLNMIHGFVSAGLGLALMATSAIDATYAVTTRPSVQYLGRRRTSLVTQRTQQAPAVTKLRELLLEMTASTQADSASDTP